MLVLHASLLCSLLCLAQETRVVHTQSVCTLSPNDMRTCFPFTVHSSLVSSMCVCVRVGMCACGRVHLLCVHMSIFTLVAASPSSHSNHRSYSHSHCRDKYDLKPADPDLQPAPRRLQLMLKPPAKRFAKDGTGHLAIKFLVYVLASTPSRCCSKY